MNIGYRDSSQGIVPDHLTAAIQDVYKQAELKVTVEPHREVESTEYGACRFALDGHTVAYRVAKTTPTKVGQFVTSWKRPKPDAEIVPLDSSDGVDFLVVSVFDEKNQGQFVFNRQVLLEKGIMSNNGKGGKLSFRLYAPWVKTEADAAKKTQAWQVRYFFSMTGNAGVDINLVRKLFRVNSKCNKPPILLPRDNLHLYGIPIQRRME